MIPSAPQVPWTDDQWARVNQVIQQEARRARVAATFLPLYGPLPADTDFVPRDVISYVPGGNDRSKRLAIDDQTTVQLATLQVKVFLRGAQMSDPDLTSALQLFRRAANVLARLEDVVIFRGLPDLDGREKAFAGLLPDVWEITGGQKTRGLLSTGDGPSSQVSLAAKDGQLGERLVHEVSKSIGRLEGNGHFGPFAVVLDQDFFTAVQTPDAHSLVLPQDRIIPFLGGGSLLRSSALPNHSGVVVALGGSPVELVLATDVSLAFLQITTDPMYVFRVFEKIVLRIKEPDAIQTLTGKA
jgi:uncharacterized linocin/CFP29 family protein